jgi:hypothetical protein
MEQPAGRRGIYRQHVRIGIDSLKQLINKGLTVKHLKF